MPIVVHCPNPKCAVRLTLGDDRAGDVLNCPKCGHQIRVPAIRQPPPPAPVPQPLPPPEEDDEPPFTPIRRRRRKSLLRNPILWIVGLVLLVGVAAAGWVAVNRFSPTEGASDPLLARLALSSTERKIVGTWTAAYSDLGSKVRSEETTTYKADGTFDSEAKVFTLRDGTFEMKATGTWKVQDNLLIVQVTKEQWDHKELPGFRLNQFAPGRKLLEGQSLTAEIVSVSDTHLVTKDTATGETSAAQRKR